MHTHKHTHLPHTHIYTNTHTQGMTEWPEAVMGEWAVIWRGEPGDWGEKGWSRKEEKRRAARGRERSTTLIPKQPGQRATPK